MVQVVVFPDVEDLVRLYLTQELVLRAGFGDVKVFATTLPAKLPAECLLVRRTGGPERDLVTDLPQLTLEARAKTAGRAQRILALSLGLMKAAARAGLMGDVPVYETNLLNGGYLDPDPDHPTIPRYTATLQLAVRGKVVA